MNRDIDLAAIPVQAPLRGSTYSSAVQRAPGREAMEEEPLSQAEIEERERQLNELINGM